MLLVCNNYKSGLLYKTTSSLEKWLKARTGRLVLHFPTMLSVQYEP